MFWIAGGGLAQAEGKRVPEPRSEAFHGQVWVDAKDRVGKVAAWSRKAGYTQAEACA